MKNVSTGAVIAILFFLCATTRLAADYPGNANFRNVGVTFAAQNRTDWVTNVTTMVGSARNPGTSTPIDWSCAQSITNGIDYIPAVLTTAGGWPRTLICHFIRIDLSTPNLRFTGTDRCADWGDPMPEDYAAGYEKRTVREKTSDFLARNRGSKSKGGKAREAVIAWNNAAWSPWVSPYANLWGSPNSPLYSDGIQISETATGYGTHASASVPSGMIVMFKDGTADLIPQMTKAIAKKTWFCVPAFVARLVSSGQVPTHGDTSVDPRTAIGISQDKRYIYLLACDGRRDGWSSGCDFPSLSTLLVAMGCWEAINLDGGGSSTLCGWDAANDKPSVLNRPSNSASWNMSALRDNGSNAAVYFKSPDAMIGSYIYDDMDFLVQDIVDGETPSGDTTINLLGEAEFSAEHPCIPAGLTYTLVSTNNASIGWADGVTPQIAANSTVTFRNVRFRDMAEPLSIAAGGKVILDGVPGLCGVTCADSSAIEVKASLPSGIRIGCAAATKSGDVFASTTLSLADARVEAAKIVCETDDTLVAEAVEVGNEVKFAWSEIVSFGNPCGKIAKTLDRGIVTVDIPQCASEYSSGYKLKLTVTSEDGLRSSAQMLAFTGAGEYVFDTASAAATDPAICGTGYNYGYKIEFVDSDGEIVPHSASVSGTMGLGVAKPWFLARAADDSVMGGAWIAKPDIEDGVYKIVESEDAVFGASDSRSGRVRLEADTVFKGYLTDSRAAMKLAEFKTTAMPHGACFIAQGAEKGTLAWRGLVSENGEPVFKMLVGPTALYAPCKVITDVDWSSGAPRVRYSVSFAGGAETVLVDENGESWFSGASSADAAIGEASAYGVGDVGYFQGLFLKRDIKRYSSLVIR